MKRAINGNLSELRMLETARSGCMREKVMKINIPDRTVSENEGAVFLNAKKENGDVEKDSNFMIFAKIAAHCF